MTSTASVSSASVQTVTDTLQNAVSQNQISPATAKSMIDQLDPIALAGCAGISIDDLDSEENTLVTVVIDASASMYSYRQAVIDAYNDAFLAPLQGAKNAESILASCWIFSGGGTDACRLLHGYTPVSQCPKLDESAYDPDSSTPLWEAVQKAMLGIVSYGLTLAQAGSRVKHIVIVLSDGGENSSKRGITSPSLQAQSADLIKQETFVLSYVFFGDEQEGEQYADEIGFPPQHRIPAGLSASEIRRILGEASASVISTSQGQIGKNISANAFFATP